MKKASSMFNQYVDFEITISAAGDARYAVAVSGPGGDAGGMLLLPPTGDAGFQALIARLAALDTDEEALAQLGQLLFQALFQGAIKDVYTRGQGMLASDQGLRLRLNIAPSEAATIPTRGRWHCSTRRSCAICRNPRASQRSKPVCR
jgi:hypothetical protein